MFKLLTGITLLSMIPMAQAQITNAAQLASHLASLSDNELEVALQRPKAFGACKFRKSLSSVGCQYTIQTKANTILCFNNHPTYGVVAAGVGNWSQNLNASSYATARAYMDNVRSTIVGSASTAQARALNYARKLLASPSNCNLNINDYQPSIAKSFDNFNPSDVQFYQRPSSKTLACSTTVFSRDLWDSATCSFVKKSIYLPESTCKSLKNKFSKTTTTQIAGLSAVPIATYTLAVAKEDAISLLPETQVLSLPEANSAVSVIDGIAPDVLAVAELNSAQVAAAATDSAQKPLLAQFYKSISTAPTEVEVPAEAVAVKDAINSHASVVSLAGSLPAFDAEPIKEVKNNFLTAVDTAIITNIQTAGLTPPTTVYVKPLPCSSVLIKMAPMAKE